MSKKILWTEEQIDLLKSNLHLTYNQLRLLIGRGKTAIAEKIKELGLKKVATQRKYHFNESFFEEIDSEESAYWLGFIAADGCVCVANKDGALRMSINLSVIDTPHLYSFRECIGGDMPINEIVSNHENAFGYSEQVRINVNSKIFCNDLINYGIGFRKTDHLKMPELKECYYKHFLRGFIDGDGWYYSRYMSDYNSYRFEVGIVGNSLEMFESIKLILEKENIRCNIYNVKNNTKTKTLRISSKQSVVNLINFLYEDSNIYLNRKYEKVQKILKLAV